MRRRWGIKMKVKISEKLPYNKTVITLFMLALLSAFLSISAAEIFIPFAAGILSALFVFENRRVKPFSISASAVILVVDVVMGILSGSYAPITSLGIIAIAFLMAFCFAGGKSKAETVFYVTVTALAFLLLSFLFVAFEQTGTYTFASAKEFYFELYETLKQTVVDSFTKLTTAEGVQLIDEETAVLLFDSAISSLISVVAVVGFIIAGVSLKVFSAIARRISDTPEYVTSWRFVTSSAVAYFFLVLVLVSFFMSSGTDTLSITVANLYSIFAVVFAYSGFGYLYRIFSAKRGPVFAALILVVGTLVLSSVAITLLSVFGVIFTITYNKQLTGKSD
jgi:hypothetical protein